MLIIIICSVVLGYGVMHAKRGGFFARGVEGVEHLHPKPKELPRSTHVIPLFLSTNAHQRIVDNPGNFKVNILSLIPRGR